MIELQNNIQALEIANRLLESNIKIAKQRLTSIQDRNRELLKQYETYHNAAVFTNSNTHIRSSKFKSTSGMAKQESTVLDKVDEDEKTNKQRLMKLELLFGQHQKSLFQKDEIVLKLQENQRKELSIIADRIEQYKRLVIKAERLKAMTEIINEDCKHTVKKSRKPQAHMLNISIVKRGMTAKMQSLIKM